MRVQNISGARVPNDLDAVQDQAETEWLSSTQQWVEDSRRALRAGQADTKREVPLVRPVLLKRLSDCCLFLGGLCLGLAAASYILTASKSGAEFMLVVSAILFLVLYFGCRELASRNFEAREDRKFGLEMGNRGLSSQPAGRDEQTRGIDAAREA